MPDRPRRSLFARLAVVLLVLLVGVGAVWVVTTLITTGLYQEELEQRLNRDLARSLLADTAILERGVDEEIEEGAGLGPDLEPDLEPELEHIFHTLMVVNPRIEVYLLDVEGRILAFSAPEGKVVRDRVSLAPVEAFLAGERRLPIRGDDPRQESGVKIFSAAPIEAPSGAVVGYLYVVLGSESYDSAAALLRSSYLLRLAAVGAVAAVLVALAAGLFLFRRLTRRLERLDERIRTYRPVPATDAGETEADETLVAGAPARGDEIDRLESAFSRLTARVERQVGELTELDALRRELVANVSHDLRTPIAALQGYVETLLLKDDSLTAEERRRYLEIAARHAEHLGKLVAQLFELARLDVEEARLEIEPVSLAELAQDVVQKFHLAAEAQGIDLGVRLPARLPYVAADMRLLERAFDNLIENALAHTPEGGRVTVEVAERDGGIEVRLADTGSGIPEHELPRIFDRFHRGEDRGRRDRPGVGLGLAIAKRILELHGSELAVESEVGEGTAFTFRLAYTEH